MENTQHSSWSSIESLSLLISSLSSLSHESIKINNDHKWSGARLQNQRLTVCLHKYRRCDLLLLLFSW